jgi:hypothetical protein
MIVKLCPGMGAYETETKCNLMLSCEPYEGDCIFSRNKKEDLKCVYCKLLTYGKSKEKYTDKNGCECTKETFKLRIPNLAEFEYMKNRYDAKTLRIGKTVEPGFKPARPVLYGIFDMSTKVGIRAVLVTKLLELDLILAKKIIENKGLLQISLGNDDWEYGVVRLGFTNKKRLEIALAYKTLGVPTQVRIVADVTQPPTDFYKKVIAAMGSENVLLTPIVCKGRPMFSLMRPDMSWNEAIKQGLYTKQPAQTIVPGFLHEEWKIVPGICGVIGTTKHCNNCFPDLDFDVQAYRDKFRAQGWIKKREVLTEAKKQKRREKRLNQKLISGAI